MKRSVLVTGANLGIGLAAARRLAELGNAVMIGSRNCEDGEQTARSLCRLDLDVSFVQMDLNDPGSIDRAVNTLAAGGFRVECSGEQCRGIVPGPFAGTHGQTD